MTACSTLGNCFIYASKELQNDRQVALEAIKTCSRTLNIFELLSDQLKKDPEILREAIIRQFAR